VKVVEHGRRFCQEESGRFQERYPEWQQYYPPPTENTLLEKINDYAHKYFPETFAIVSTMIRYDVSLTPEYTTSTHLVYSVVPRLSIGCILQPGCDGTWGRDISGATWW
jgi:hypothetical protein